MLLATPVDLSRMHPPHLVPTFVVLLSQVSVVMSNSPDPEEHSPASSEHDAGSDTDGSEEVDGRAPANPFQTCRCDQHLDPENHPPAHVDRRCQYMNRGRQRCPHEIDDPVDLPEDLEHSMVLSGDLLFDPQDNKCLSLLNRLPELQNNREDTFYAILAHANSLCNTHKRNLAYYFEAAYCLNAREQVALGGAACVAIRELFPSEHFVAVNGDNGDGHESEVEEEEDEESESGDEEESESEDEEESDESEPAPVHHARQSGKRQCRRPQALDEFVQ